MTINQEWIKNMWNITQRNIALLLKIDIGNLQTKDENRGKIILIDVSQTQKGKNGMYSCISTY